jgi:hypothetical protein
VHHQHAPDALGAAGRHVEHARPRLELARVDAEVGELADERVGHDLEGERRERLGVVRVADGRAVLVALDRLVALDGRHVQRRRQEVDDGVQQRLHALVLERGAAQRRRELELERRLADRLAEQVDRDLGVLEDELQELVVVVRDLLEQVLAGGRGDVLVVVGDVDDVDVLAQLVVVDDRLHVQKVDDPQEVGPQRRSAAGSAPGARRDDRSSSARPARSSRRCGPSC